MNNNKGIFLIIYLILQIDNEYVYKSVIYTF